MKYKDFTRNSPICTLKQGFCNNILDVFVDALKSIENRTFLCPILISGGGDVAYAVSGISYGENTGISPYERNTRARQRLDKQKQLL